MIKQEFDWLQLRWNKTNTSFQKGLVSTGLTDLAAWAEWAGWASWSGWVS